MNVEFEVEHFGFNAEQLSLERKHYLQKIIRNALNTIAKKINAAGKTGELLLAAKEEIFENIWSSISSENERLSNLDTKYFTIPDHVLLPPYVDHVKSYTEEDEKEMDKNLEILKNTFLENSTMISLLKLENAQYKNFTPFVEKELEIQQQLKESFDNVDMETVIRLDKQNNLLNNSQK